MMFDQNLMSAVNLINKFKLDLIKNKTTFEELVDKSSITLSLPNQKSLKFCPDEIETLK